MKPILRTLLFLALPFLSLYLGEVAVVQAEARQISVKGSADFKVNIDGGSARLTGDVVDGCRLEREQDTWVVKDRTGAVRGWTKALSDGSLSLGTGPGVELYKLKNSNEGYSIITASGDLLNRVKVKEDKFNLYNKDSKRVLHGKLKEDGYGVKDEQGNQTIKIKGASSLREASFFALQISPELQVTTWAQEMMR